MNLARRAHCRRWRAAADARGRSRSSERLARARSWPSPCDEHLHQHVLVAPGDGRPEGNGKAPPDELTGPPPGCYLRAPIDVGGQVFPCAVSFVVSFRRLRS